MTWPSVVNGPEKFSVEAADCIEWFRSMPADSVDLVMGSPPYEAARSYGIDFKLKGQEWIDWMLQVYTEARRVCKGLVCFVVQGQTRKFQWSGVPALLTADLIRAGFAVRNPPIFHRVGIPGSGGPDWLRSDYEWCVCTTRGGKLPWSDNTACGHTPKWAPGGEMSHRVSDGSRVNQWGHPIESGATVVDDGGSVTCKGKRPSHRLERGNFKGGLPAPAPARARFSNGKQHTKAKVDGDEDQTYYPPAIANPGTVISLKVGGGLMGHKLAHANEAPMPLGLSEFFVRSFCHPNGIVADPYSGSGTTGHAAIKYGRRFVGCDLRQSQADLSLRRLNNVTPEITGP
jgi:hypothetical protein